MPEKVCVAMSGGVDSSVAAALLQQQGYEVVGAYMKNWSLEQVGVEYHPWEQDAQDARQVCKQLGMDFHIFDFEKEYQSRVVNAFVAEYRRGNTPNPDVLCNREIKFDLFLEQAKHLGADKIATGHYAQITADVAAFHLLRARDQNKDQSYFLYTLTQKELSRIVFPIGHLLKSEVRALAEQFQLPNAHKKDSQGICFIGPVSMRRFLSHYLKPNAGNVVTSDGRTIGHHDGVQFYTEGQRHGFDTGGSHVPLYVAQKRIQDNVLEVAPSGHPSLYRSYVTVDDSSWTNGMMPSGNVEVRVRYRQPLHHATITLKHGGLQLQFENPIEGVASGQSAVLYYGEEVIGGGVIRDSG